MTRYLTLKELASLLEISPDTLRRNLKKFGLDSCRDKFLKKPIRFFRDRAVRALAERGFTVKL